MRAARGRGSRRRPRGPAQARLTGEQVAAAIRIADGEIVARGRLVHEGGRVLVAESELRDQAGRLLATGSGTFTRSRIALTAGIGYVEPGPSA